MEKEFEVKSLAELEKMTPEQKEDYVKAKAEHDLEQAKKAAEQTAKEVVKKAQKENPNITVKEITESDAFKDAIEAMKTSIQENTDTSLKSLVEKEMEKNRSQNFTESGKILKDFKAELKSIVEKDGEESYATQKGESRIELKAFDTLDVHTVASVTNADYPANGTQSAIGSVYRNLVAMNLGVVTQPRPYAKIMDFVDIRPLTADRMLIFNKKIRGSFEVTPECVEKPVVYANYESQSVDAEAVAALYYTDTKIRRFYPNVVADFEDTFEELLMEKIPNVVAAAIDAAAVGFTPLASQAAYQNPTNYDAIAQLVASQKKLGYVPDAVFLSPVDYALLITDKSDENGKGVYRLSDGNSIVIVDGNTIKLGSMNLTVIEDPTITDGRIRIGAIRQSVKVGLDGAVIYLETDGITDLENTETGHKTGVARNIRTHALEKFVATLVPDAFAGAIIEDSFLNIKAGITAA